LFAILAAVEHRQKRVIFPVNHSSFPCLRFVGKAYEREPALRVSKGFAIVPSRFPPLAGSVHVASC